MIKAIKNIEHVRDYFQETTGLSAEMFANENIHAKIVYAAEAMVAAIKAGYKIISCGNGGSMCDAMHFASELTGRYKQDRDPIPALAISDGAHLTCVANDYEYENVFARWIHAHGEMSDVLLAISTSGKSMNVYNAVMYAVDQKKMKVVVLTGGDGGYYNKDFFKDHPLITVIKAPSTITNHIQECHIKIIHILVELIERDL
jgi:D-sedoheptulose 7-phosphate isomerase